MKQQNNSISIADQKMLSSQAIQGVNGFSDVVLKRLIEEVKNDNANSMFAYDRAHNRHNRGR